MILLQLCVVVQLSQLKVLCQRNFVADFIQLELSFSQKGKVRLLSHPLEDLEVTYALHL